MEEDNSGKLDCMLEDTSECIHYVNGKCSINYVTCVHSEG